MTVEGCPERTTIQCRNKDVVLGDKMDYKELERLRQSLPDGKINDLEQCYNGVKKERLVAIETMSQRDLQTFNKHKCHQDAIEAVKAIMPDISLSIIEHDMLFIADAVQSKVKKILDEKKKNASVETNTGEHCTETCPEGGVETGDMVRCCLLY